MTTTIVETERLKISRLDASSDEHCQFIVDLYNCPSFIAGMGETGITTKEKAATMIRNWVDKLFDRLGHGVYLVSTKAESKPVGTVTLIRGDETKDKVAYTVPDLGFAIIDTEQHKGYARESTTALIEYAKTKLNLDGVLGFTAPDNLAAQQLFEKVGLEYRGERNLAVFGNAKSKVYALPGMGDLKVYNIDD